MQPSATTSGRSPMNEQEAAFFHDFADFNCLSGYALVEHLFRRHPDEKSDVVADVQRFKRTVFYYAWSRGLGDPEDFLSDVSLKLLELEINAHYDDKFICDDGSKTTYLKYASKIAFNEARNLQKLYERLDKRECIKQSSDEYLERVPAPDDDDARKFNKLLQLMQLLKPASQEALYLYFLDDLNDKEAAHKLKIKLSRFGQRRRRALKELRTLYHNS